MPWTSNRWKIIIDLRALVAEYNISLARQKGQMERRKKMKLIFQIKLLEFDFANIPF